jgi:hypothetical protein
MSRCSRGEAWQAHVINYADDLISLSRGHARCWYSTANNCGLVWQLSEKMPQVLERGGQTVAAGKRNAIECRGG